MSIITSVKANMLKIDKSTDNIDNFLNDSINIAYAICMFAHKDQYRKNGDNYFNHPINARNNFLRFLRIDDSGVFNAELLKELDIPYQGVQELCLLHDVIEDTPITIDEVEEMFSEYNQKDYFENHIKEPLIYLTHKEGSYDEYISNVLKSPASAMVKLMDLVDNMNVLGLDKFEDKEQERISKYNRCVRLINDKYHFLEKAFKYVSLIKNSKSIED